MGALASSLTSSEKAAIYEQSKTFLRNDLKAARNFSNLIKEDQQWVLSYLSTGRGTIPYQLITDFDSLNISPEKEFFEEYLFYSNMILKYHQKIMKMLRNFIHF